MSTGLTVANLHWKPGGTNKRAPDTAADALRQVWSAARALLVDEEMTALFNGETVFTRVIVPVIVAGARLWECRLVDGSPVAEEVDYMRVRTPTTGNAVLVHVMSLDRFSGFAQQIGELQQRDDHAWGPPPVASPLSASDSEPEAP